MKQHEEWLIIYLRPNNSLEDSVQVIWSEAVGVKVVKKVLDSQDTESPQVLQRIDATGTQLEGMETNQC